MTTGVHVTVFLLTASSHVRTEPSSVIGHTRRKKKSGCGALIQTFVRFNLISVDDDQGFEVGIQTVTDPSFRGSIWVVAELVSNEDSP